MNGNVYQTHEEAGVTSNQFIRTSLMLRSYAASHLPLDRGQRQIIKMLDSSEEVMLIPPVKPGTPSPRENDKEEEETEPETVSPLDIAYYMHRLKEYEQTQKPSNQEK